MEKVFWSLTSTATLSGHSFDPGTCEWSTASELLDHTLVGWGHRATVGGTCRWMGGGAPSTFSMCEHSRLDFKGLKSCKYLNHLGCISERAPKINSPFQWHRDTGFSHLIKALNPHYSLTSRTFWTTEVIPDVYGRACKSVKDKLQKVSILILLVSYFQTRSGQFFFWGLQCVKIWHNKTNNLYPAPVCPVSYQWAFLDKWLIIFLIKSLDLLKGSVVQHATSCLNINFRTLEFTHQIWAHLWC